ncbi:phospholipase A1 [Dermacentor silvarum]|uniref:phospholipase A1 n=1 Tax=Dermacentor silvarum TaxID=543639 RepID=UPI00189C0741|nr:phospholipase A1 [Dermacentor silvarum]
MNFLPLLMAMYGMNHPERHDVGVTARRSLHGASPHDHDLRSNSVLEDPGYMYGELTKEDFGDIALSVKRAEHLASLHFVIFEVAKPLSFPELPGQFDMSGNLRHFVPQSPNKVKPQFLLHTNKASHPGKLLFETGLDKAGFEKMASLIDPGQKLYIIVHGFLSSAKTAWMQDMKKQILDKENASVVLVDWSNGCGSILGYSTAAANTRTVARSLAMMVKTLEDAGAVKPEHVHYIGHSLGAQTGGFFGKDVKELTGKVVGRITGLDPAGPLFESYGSPSDKRRRRLCGCAAHEHRQRVDGHSPRPTGNEHQLRTRGLLPERWQGATGLLEIHLLLALEVDRVLRRVGAQV